ncbi:MAG: hypothetical protein WAT36_01755 [Chromatiaceae bacterium]
MAAAFYQHPDIQDLMSHQGLVGPESFEVLWVDAPRERFIICRPDYDVWLYYSPETSWQRVFSSYCREHSEEVLKQKYGYRYLRTIAAYDQVWEIYIDPRE